jgi:O-antigen/teichoic acid export membrane protein
MTGAFQVVMLQGVTYGLQVLFMLMAARLLGPAAQGKYALLRTSVYLIEAFMWFGLTSGIPYFIAKDRDRYHDVLLNLCFIYLGAVTIVGTIMLILFRGYLHLELRVITMLIAWVLVLALSQVLLKVFLGEKRYDLYSYANLIGVFMLFASLGAYKMLGPFSLARVILCNIWGSLAVLLFGVFLHRASLKKVKLLMTFPLELAKQVFKVGTLGYLSSIAFLVLYRIDFFFVGYFLSAAQLGVYAVAVLIIEAFQKVPDWLGMILAPKVASGMDADGHITRKYLWSSLLFTTVLAGGLLILQRAQIDLITVVVGSDYRGVQTVVIWLIPRALLHGAMVIFAGNLAGRGYTVYHPAAGIASALLLLVLDSILMPIWGLKGAIVGVTLAYVAATTIMLAGYRRDAVRAAHEARKVYV